MKIENKKFNFNFLTLPLGYIKLSIFETIRIKFLNIYHITTLKLSKFNAF